MIKRKSLTLTITLLAFILITAQSSTNSSIGEQTAKRSLPLALEMLEKKEYKTALDLSTRALVFDNLISDLWYVKAAAILGEEKNVREALDSVKTGIELNNFISFTKEKARLLYASLLSRIGRSGEALLVLNQAPALSSLEADIIKIVCYYKSKSAAGIKEARKEVNKARKLYPEDPRIPYLFFSYEYLLSINTDAKGTLTQLGKESASLALKIASYYKERAFKEVQTYFNSVKEGRKSEESPFFPNTVEEENKTYNITGAEYAINGVEYTLGKLKSEALLYSIIAFPGEISWRVLRSLLQEPSLSPLYPIAYLTLFNKEKVQEKEGGAPLFSALDAVNYFFDASDNRVDYNALIKLSLLVKEDVAAKEALVDKLSSYEGVLYIDSDFDKEAELYIKYFGGRPQYFYYDKDNDTVPEYEGFTNWGEITYISTKDYIVKYDLYPRVSDVIMLKDDKGQRGINKTLLTTLDKNIKSLYEEVGKEGGGRKDKRSKGLGRQQEASNLTSIIDSTEEEREGFTIRDLVLRPEVESVFSFTVGEKEHKTCLISASKEIKDSLNTNFFIVENISFSPLTLNSLHKDCSFYTTSIAEDRLPFSNDKKKTVTYSVLEGENVEGNYYIAGVRYATIKFNKGEPVVRIIDTNLDGKFDTREEYSLSSTSMVKQNLTNWQDAATLTYGIPLFASPLLYLKESKTDYNQNTIYEYIERYSEDGSLVILCDFNEDGEADTVYKKEYIKKMANNKDKDSKHLARKEEENKIEGSEEGGGEVEEVEDESLDIKLLEERFIRSIWEKEGVTQAKPSFKESKEQEPDTDLIETTSFYLNEKDIITLRQENSVPVAITYRGYEYEINAGYKTGFFWAGKRGKEEEEEKIVKSFNNKIGMNSYNIQKKIVDLDDKRAYALKVAESFYAFFFPYTVDNSINTAESSVRG